MKFTKFKEGIYFYFHSSPLGYEGVIVGKVTAITDNKIYYERIYEKKGTADYDDLEFDKDSPVAKESKIIKAKDIDAFLDKIMVEEL